MDSPSHTTLSRRSFLTWATASAAWPLALSVPRRPSSAPGDAAVAVIGLGACGITRARAVASAPERGIAARLTALCDVFEPHKTRARALFGCPVRHAWEEVLADPAVDAVVIATPDHWHAPLIRAALAARKHLYCEGPVALTLDDSAAIAHQVLRSGLVVHIGPSLAPDPRWQAARRLVRDGRLGPLRWVQATCAHPATGGSAGPPPAATSGALDWPRFHGAARPRPFTAERFTRWQGYADYVGRAPGPLICDRFTALLEVLGPRPPARISAAGGIYAEDGRDVPDSFVMALHYPEGHSLVLTTPAASPAAAPLAVFRGEEASLCVEHHGVRLTPERGRSSATFLPAEPPPPDGLLDPWLEAVREGRTDPGGVERARLAAASLALAGEAYTQRRTVDAARVLSA